MLIHVNGRVYDPVIGRFLSPDSMIQAPYNTQSFNRYSYVMNNPLSLVDPSGYESETDNDHPPNWKPGGGQGGGPTEDDKKKVEEDMKKLQEFVDQNSNFDSVEELIQEYKENGFDGVQYRAAFGEAGNQDQTSNDSWSFTAEWYSPWGGGFTLGKNSDQSHFLTVHLGFGVGGGFVYDENGSAVNFQKGDMNYLPDMGMGFEAKVFGTALFLSGQMGNTIGIDGMHGGYAKQLDSLAVTNEMGLRVGGNVSFDWTFLTPGETN